MIRKASQWAGIIFLDFWNTLQAVKVPGLQLVHHCAPDIHLLASQVCFSTLRCFSMIYLRFCHKISEAVDNALNNLR